MTLLPDADVTSRQVKRDNGGHVLIKTSYAAATPSFQYTMKVLHPHLVSNPYRTITASLLRTALPTSCAKMCACSDVSAVSRTHKKHKAR